MTITCRRVISLVMESITCYSNMTITCHRVKSLVIESVTCYKVISLVISDNHLS